MRRLAFCLLLSFVALAAPSRASAAGVEACLAAAERGEPLKKQGRLLAARKELSICARDQCPAAVRNICRKDIGEIDSSMPTLVVSVRDGKGNEVRDAHVYVDGELVTPAPDGVIAVDPGARTVRVEHGGRDKERVVEVLLGGKRTPVVMHLDEVAPPPPPMPSPSPTPRPGDAAAERPRASGPPVLVTVLGGIGVASLVGGGIFGAKWMSDSACSPACSRDEVDRVRTDAIATDVLLGAGVLALGVSAVLWLTGNGSRPESAK